MTLLSRRHWSVLLAPAALLVVGCGSSPSTGGTVTQMAAPATPRASLPAALTAADIVTTGSFTQRSDGLLGGLANTDARVFVTSDGSLVVEVDLVTDTGAAGAASDYPPFQSAAAKQVGTQSATSSPRLGQRANEYTGVTAAGKKAVSISFIEGRYIAVVTAVGATTVTPAVVTTSAESIAQAQDSKINSIGS